MGYLRHRKGKAMKKQKLSYTMTGLTHGVFGKELMTQPKDYSEFAYECYCDGHLKGELLAEDAERKETGLELADAVKKILLSEDLTPADLGV